MTSVATRANQEEAIPSEPDENVTPDREEAESDDELTLDVLSA